VKRKYSNEGKEGNSGGRKKEVGRGTGRKRFSGEWTWENTHCGSDRVDLDDHSGSLGNNSECDRREGLVAERGSKSVKVQIQGGRGNLRPKLRLPRTCMV